MGSTKMLVLELARCEWYVERRENIIALGNIEWNRQDADIALGLGLAACQKGSPSASSRPLPWFMN